MRHLHTAPALLALLLSGCDLAAASVRVSGTVADADTGEPLRASLDLYQTQFLGEGRFYGRTESDARGRWTALFVDAGPNFARVYDARPAVPSATAPAFYFRQAVALPGALGPPASVEVRMRPGTVVRFELGDADGLFHLRQSCPPSSFGLCSSDWGALWRGHPWEARLRADTTYRFTLLQLRDTTLVPLRTLEVRTGRRPATVVVTP